MLIRINKGVVPESKQEILEPYFTVILNRTMAQRYNTGQHLRYVFSLLHDSELSLLHDSEQKSVNTDNHVN